MLLFIFDEEQRLCMQAEATQNFTLRDEFPPKANAQENELSAFIRRVMKQEGYEHLDILNVLDVYSDSIEPYYRAEYRHKKFSPDDEGLGYDFVHSVLAVVEWLQNHHPDKLFDYSYDGVLKPKFPKRKSDDQFGDIARYMRADAGLEP